ncbi:MASE1 domain-containing protein [Fulvivirga lutea]|uniref:histidine kinase n=1 Tax=Fulvivirga lutea TaxID=2810512 RepID=A0A974WNQ9_9BACT|nr:MASE1 domain-containing protein [Fulvivirga lutea]QSE98853.1 MASE1 domain-containing protein [Fulvivirga lutea]
MSLNLLKRYHLDFKIVIVAAIYYLTAVLGYFLAFDNSSILPVWPPSGVAFALLVLMGRKCWPGITIGALIANVMAFWNLPDLPAQTIISISSFIAIGNTLEAVLGYYLINNWIKTPFPFNHTQNAFRFLFVAVLIAGLGSVVSASSLLLNGVIGIEEFSITWLSLGVGKTVAILIFTPFILSVFQKFKWKASREKWLELVVAIIGGAGLYMLLQVPDMAINRALPFIVIPFLLWLAFRFPLTVSMTAVVVVSILAIYFSSLQLGPFILGDSYSSMLLLQIFVGVVSVITIVLSATVKERAEAQEKLLKFNENLEEMVKIRTKALNSQIDTRRKAEEKLQNTNDELVKRNVELDNFVYSVSHDLRAPIASMLGIVNLAKKEDDIVMKDMYFDMINGSAEQLDNFIKEILDQSQNARSEVKNDVVDFNQIIEETFDHFKYASADGKPVKKNITIKGDRTFTSDPWRIKVILNNLISNAIRYRNGKSPVVDVTVKVENELAKIEVKDNGRGIPAEHLDKVCNMFYRATDDGAGSGLGLYIVKETVDKLGGELKVNSEVGKGTTINVSIPKCHFVKKIAKEEKENVALS